MFHSIEDDEGRRLRWFTPGPATAWADVERIVEGLPPDHVHVADLTIGQPQATILAHTLALFDSGIATLRDDS